MNRWMFEVFSHAHYIFGLITLGAVWMHPLPQWMNATIQPYVLLATATFIVVKTVRGVQVLYNNVSVSGTSTACINRLPAGVEVRIQLARKRSVRAGQFIYLSLPGLSLPSTLTQSHPFQVSWVYHDLKGNQVVVLIIEPRHGLTGTILLKSNDSVVEEYRAFLEGPYGKPLPIGKHCTLLLFATGIGITGFLLYVKEILELHAEHRTNARVISLFWEVENDGNKFPLLSIC